MPGEKIETETGTQSDAVDHSAAIAEISSELFGQGTDGEEGKSTAEGEEGKSSDVVAGVDAADPPPQTDGQEEKPAGEDNSAEVQEIGAPKTWTKDALEKWATVDPVVKAEIAKREEDFLNGITQYKAAAEIGQSYDKVVEPYKPLLQAENIDPVQLFQSFAANHYLLTRGTPQQKIELTAALIEGYGVPLAELLNHMADNPHTPVDPKIVALEKELAEIKGGLTKRQEFETSTAQEALTKEITAFAADPAHPYFNELATDIQKLFAAGLVTSLPEAYERAVYSNPTTRQKEIDRLTAEKLSSASEEEAKRKDKRARSTADTVITTPKSKDGTVPLGSIDDTLAETMAAITSRG